MTNHEAIDILTNIIGRIEANHGADYDQALHLAIDALKDNQWIPCCERLSDGREVLTDPEKRIFLKAIKRELKVCREVDDEFPDAPTNLVHICREIERKVKATLWS